MLRGSGTNNAESEPRVLCGESNLLGEVLSSQLLGYHPTWEPTGSKIDAPKYVDSTILPIQKRTGKGEERETARALDQSCTKVRWPTNLDTVFKPKCLSKCDQILGADRRFIKLFFQKCINVETGQEVHLTHLYAPLSPCWKGGRCVGQRCVNCTKGPKCTLNALVCTFGMTRPGVRTVLNDTTYRGWRLRRGFPIVKRVWSVREGSLYLCFFFWDLDFQVTRRM